MKMGVSTIVMIVGPLAITLSAEGGQVSGSN
jgi:hypothetical protein